MLSVFIYILRRLSKSGGHQDEVSVRSLLLCIDLLTTVCQAAIRFCDDALESHLQVIVGTLTAQVTQQPAISQQVGADIKSSQVSSHSPNNSPIMIRSVSKGIWGKNGAKSEICYGDL